MDVTETDGTETDIAGNTGTDQISRNSEAL